MNCSCPLCNYSKSFSVTSTHTSPRYVNQAFKIPCTTVSTFKNPSKIFAIRIHKDQSPWRKIRKGHSQKVLGKEI